MSQQNESDDRAPITRPRGWLAAAAAAGSVGGGFYAAAIILPALAAPLSAGGVFLGVLIGALLMRRARDRELLETLTPDDEEVADREWELSDIAEYYRHAASDRRRAEFASDAKSQFLTTVSHELRNPLGGVVGLTDLLRTTPLSPEQESFAEAIRNSGTLMLGLVDDMLDFAKIEAGRFDLSLQPTSIAAVLEDVAELFFSRTSAKGLDIATYVDPSLPESALVDPARLRQVLINLVGNAVKFTEVGGVEISARRDPIENGIRFAVRDTGQGVQPELADRIFDDFERAGVDQGPPIAGSGLGLGIARKIVRAMGSDINLAGQADPGSTFVFVLPISGSATPRNERFDFLGARALLIGPSGPTRSLAAQNLADHGAGVQQVDSPSRAAALAGAAAAAGEDFDFVLVDQRSTSNIGAALATIREAAGKPIRAAILIAPGSRLSIAEYREEGFDAYLVRPLRSASLLRIADRMVSGDEHFGIDPHDASKAPVKKTTIDSPRRVLLAEDDDVNALLLRSMLMRQGHDVTSFVDGEAALAAAGEEQFDVMLIDVSLPKLDGIAVARGVRRREAQRGGTRSLLIAVTADARPETRDRALAAGFDRHVLKPLTPEALSELIRATSAAAA